MVKNNKPVRILEATISNDKGGLTGYICQNYRFIDKDKIQFDFITYEDKIDFQKEFEEQGAKFYRLPKISKFFAYIKALKNIQKEYNHKIIHFHMSYTNMIPIIAAKIAGIDKIFLHAHSTQIDDNRKYIRWIKTGINFMGKYLSIFFVDQFFACSNKAAKWMFPQSIINSDKFSLAHNAIDIKKFVFNSRIREIKRKELGINDNTFCVGHIGRFSYQKNQEFVVEIFYELQKIHEDAVLLLIGKEDQEVYNRVIQKVNDLKIDKNVKILGIRDDIPALYQAMDCFILPSRFEGLGIVTIEAQASGLYTILADTVPYEAKVTNLVDFISLNKAPKYWAERILSRLVTERKNHNCEIREAGYDIENEVVKLKNRYLSLV